MQEEQLERLAQWSVGLDISGTAIQDAAQARKIHIQDSLSGLEVAPLTAAERIIDIGSGAGFPGLVLGVALPDAQIVLLDSVRKKMEAAAQIAAEMGLSNVECVWGRAEEIAETGSPHREGYDVVTARALAPLAVLLEYAAPLLKIGGSLVAWKGSPSQEELDAARAAEAELGFETGELTETEPFQGSTARHFYVARKQFATAEKYPRRAGVALKRPLGS